MAHNKATRGCATVYLLRGVRALVVLGSRRLGLVIGLCLVLSQLGVVGAYANDQTIENIRKLPFERRAAGALLYSKSDRTYETFAGVYADLTGLPQEKVEESWLERDQALSVYAVRFGKGRGILGGLVGQGDGEQDIGGIYKVSKGKQDVLTLAGEGWRRVPLPQAGAADEVWAKTQTGDKPYEWMRVQRKMGGLIFIVEMNWPAGKYAEKDRAVQILERFQRLLRNAEMAQLLDPTPEATVVTCRRPPSDSEQVDKMLEYIGTWLLALTEAPPSPWQASLAEPKARLIYVDGYFKEDLEQVIKEKKHNLEQYYAWVMAAQLARTQWDQAEALLTMSHRGVLQVSWAQNQRIKAYAHWVRWLQKRASIFTADDYHRFVTTDPKPTYPLVGPATKMYYERNEVKPPIDFRLIYDKNPEDIWKEERWKAFMDSLAEGVVVAPLAALDFVYTRGYAVSLYYSLRNRSALPLGLAVLFNTPVGPPLTVAWAAYEEASQFRELSFPEHVANITALATASYQIYTGPRKPAADMLPDPAKGIDEGGHLQAIAAQLDGRMWKEVGPKRIERRAAYSETGADEFQTIRFGIVGKLDGTSGAGNGRRTAGFGPEIMEAEFRVVQGPDGPRYFTVHPDGKLKDPVFFLGMPGYHAWKHLTELNAGIRTGETHYREVFEGMEPFASVLREIEAAFRDPQVSPSVASKRFAQWMKDIATTPYSPWMVHLVKEEPGFRPGQPPEWGHYIIVKSKCTGRDEVLRFGIGKDQKVLGGFVLSREKFQPGGPKAAEYGQLQRTIKQGLPWWIYRYPQLSVYLE